MFIVIVYVERAHIATNIEIKQINFQYTEYYNVWLSTAEQFKASLIFPYRITRTFKIFLQRNSCCQNLQLNSQKV